MGDSEVDILAVTLGHLTSTIWDVLTGGTVFVVWAAIVMFSVALIGFGLAYVRLFVTRLSRPSDGNEDGLALYWHRYRTSQAPAAETISPSLRGQTMVHSARSPEALDKQDPR